MMNRRMASWALFTATAGALALPLHAAEQATPKVQLKTSLGTIVVQLDPAKAPKTVENFLQYVKDKHYDGTIFHRVINGFMIQGGGFTPHARHGAKAHAGAHPTRSQERPEER